MNVNPLAIEALTNNQRQLDMDGCEVGVSRQALDELLAALAVEAGAPTATELDVSLALYELITLAKGDGIRSVTDPAYTDRLFTEEQAYRLILSALSHAPSGAGEAVEKLGRFGHHPDPAIDYCIEAEALEGYYFDATNGIGKPSEGPRQIDSAFRERVSRALDFIVGGDLGAIEAKAIIRKIAAALPATEEKAVDVKADIAVIQGLIDGTDWLGTGTSQVNADNDMTRCNAAWSRILSALYASPIPAPPSELVARCEALEKALTGMVNMYCEFVESGDAGFWDPEKVAEVIDARAALANGGRADG